MKKQTLILIILIFSSLTACNQNNKKESIIGTWQRDLSEYEYLNLDFNDYYIFNEDGTGEFRNIVEGEKENVYTISEFYWESKKEGVLLKERIRTIQFSGLENRENPPTIFFDNSNPNVETMSFEWLYELDKGTLITHDLVQYNGQLISFISID